MGTVHQALGGSSNTIHWETKESVGLFRSGCITHPYSKKIDKNYILTAKCKHLTIRPEIDKEVVDGLFHAEKVGNNISRFFSLRR